MLRWIIAITLMFSVIVEGVEPVHDLYCYHCAANPFCEPRDPADPSKPISVTSESEGVFLVKCKGICYDRRLRHTTYGQTLVYRGCYERETDCVPGCFGNPEHQDCVRCCNKNMCNSARAMTFSLPVVLLCWVASKLCR